MFARGCPAFGALLMGTLAGFFGLQIPVAGGAVLCLVLWIWAAQRRKLMADNLEKEPEIP